MIDRDHPKNEVRWETKNGIPVLLEPSDAIPLVDVSIMLRFGSLVDAPGKDGTTRLLARLLRSGTKGQSAERFDEALEGLGATLSAEVAHGAARFSGAVLAKNLTAYLELVLGSLVRPGLRASDLAEARREATAELIARQDDDRWLAARALRPHLFGEHPYGRSPFGTLRSLPRIGLADLSRTFEAHLSAPNIIVGVAGAATKASLEKDLERLLGGLPSRRAAPLPVVPEPRVRTGRRVLFIDKPERTQAQLHVGTLGARLRDPHFHPLVVANTAFGGTMTSRLMRAVRVERGYSYSASARLGADREREAWTMYAHPATKDAEPCARLELELLEAWVEKGLKSRELEQAKSFLVKSHAFERDTPIKRLEPRLEAELHGLPRSFWAGFIDRVRGTTLARANQAVKATLSPDDLSIVALGTGDAIANALGRLPKVAELERRAHDTVAQGE